MTINQTVHQFIRFVIEQGSWSQLDRIYLTNRVIYLIGVEAIDPVEFIEEGTSPLELVDTLVQVAIENKKIQDNEYEVEALRGQLMDLATPSPTEINETFNKLYQEKPEKATEYFFEASKANDYIKTREIGRNIEFPVATEFGDLEITINLSKPEKDPKDIASSVKAVNVDYPKCMLCMENEGYSGRPGYPNRFNHRVIRVPLGKEVWGFQYSPYAYYNEHAIVFSETHQPMKIEKKTFNRLLKIIDWLPHYFVGSNADLPIVGGSILSHEHYQAGRFTFPIEKSELAWEFNLPQYSSVKAGVVKWPMSVIRISSDNQEELIEAADYILTKWQAYSDESLNIVAKTSDGVKHHTITPIARKRDGQFEFDLVLRDNNISEEFPDGIFHPHPELHHIKKENIGLIEVMGLAILPPRLHREMKDVREFLLGKENSIADYHLEWAQNIAKNHPITSENVEKIVNDEIGAVFLQVLKDAGVYKTNAEGEAGFKQFIETLV